MKNKFRFIILPITLLLAVDCIYAGGGNRTGTGGASQLLIPVGVRGMAIAGGNVATSSGVEALFWNPAGTSKNINSANMGDNIELFDRNGVRTPMQWDGSAGAGYSQALEEDFYAPLISQGEFSHQRVNVQHQEQDPDSLLNWLRQALRMRKRYPAFGNGDLTLLESGNPSVLAFSRVYGTEKLLIVHNLSRQKQSVRLELAPGASVQPELIFGYAKNGQILDFSRTFEMGAREYMWLKVNS